MANAGVPLLGEIGSSVASTCWILLMINTGQFFTLLQARKLSGPWVELSY